MFRREIRLLTFRIVMHCLSGSKTRRKSSIVTFRKKLELADNGKKVRRRLGTRQLIEHPGPASSGPPNGATIAHGCYATRAARHGENIMYHKVHLICSW